MAAGEPACKRARRASVFSPIDCARHRHQGDRELTLRFWPGNSLLLALALQAAFGMVGGVSAQQLPPQPAQPAQRAVPAPSASNPYAAASRWTLGVMTSGIDGTAMQMAADLARALNDGPNLRLIPMVGESSIQNVTDLLFLKGADLAVVQSDVLTHLKRTKRIAGIEERIQYITKLHSEEFHVLARMKYLCLADLNGRKVNFGLEGSGTALTAEAVFESNQVKVQPQYMDQATALEKLKTGEIDATVLVSGKPSSVFDKIRYTDRVHFLDVDFAEGLQKDYLPTVMTHDDYPDLIARNETVGTIAVSAVLAVANSRPGTEQHRKVSRFVENFFGKLDRLRQIPRHVKWHEVNPTLPLTGWVRFSAAQQWLANNTVAVPSASTAVAPGPVSTSAMPAPRALPSGDTEELFRKYLRERNAPPDSNRGELFNEFVRWYQQKNPN